MATRPDRSAAIHARRSGFREGRIAIPNQSLVTEGCGLNASISEIHMLAFLKNAGYIASIKTLDMLAYDR